MDCADLILSRWIYLACVNEGLAVFFPRARIGASEILLDEVSNVVIGSSWPAKVGSNLDVQRAVKEILLSHKLTFNDFSIKENLDVHLLVVKLSLLNGD